MADLNYVSTWACTVYVSFVVDMFSGRILGWRVSASLRADLALDALEMAIWTRGPQALERTFGESRRRTKVIGRLPGEQSCLSLVFEPAR